MKLDEKSVGECTTRELIQALIARDLPFLVIGTMIPDGNRGIGETITVTEGNRSAALGVSVLLAKVCEVRLVEAAVPLSLDDDDDVVNEDELEEEIDDIISQRNEDGPGTGRP
jgi:hypothetical protein